MCQRRDQNFPLPDGDIDQGRWAIIAEHPIPGGRLDILIQNSVLQYQCIIENKIKAYEQPNQLNNYGEWLKNNTKDFANHALIFLTVHGNEAASANGHEFFRLSYRIDIPNWLDRAIEKGIDAPAVRELVVQYKYLVENM